MSVGANWHNSFPILRCKSNLRNSRVYGTGVLSQLALILLVVVIDEFQSQRGQSLLIFDFGSPTSFRVHQVFWDARYTVWNLHVKVLQIARFHIVQLSFMDGMNDKVGMLHGDALTHSVLSSSPSK